MALARAPKCLDLAKCVFDKSVLASSNYYAILQTDFFMTYSGILPDKDMSLFCNFLDPPFPLLVDKR